MVLRAFLAAIAAFVISVPAHAAVDFRFGVEVAPPPPQVEVVPAPRSGYLWAPGYWEWRDGRHVWMPGHWIAERRGYAWVPDRWVEYRDHRGPHWHHEAGHWEREHHRYR